MEITTEKLYEILIRCEEGEEIESIEEYEVEPGVGEYQNFLSQVLRIKVLIRLKNGKQIQKAFILKIGKQGRSSYGFVEDKKFFEIESMAYSSFENFSLWAKTNGYIIEKYWPECFYKSIGQTTFMIMLQDLKELGYKMCKNGRNLLDKEHISIALDRMGRCHAMTRLYICNGRMASASWPEPKFSYLKDYHKNGLRILSKVVCSYNKSWKYISDYLIKLSDTVYDKFIECFHSVKDDFPVLSLGDCWTNNILFKYSNDKRPIDVRFIDFQLAGINSFAWDLHSLLYITLLPRFRMDNMTELLSTYENAYNQMFSSLNGDPSLIPSHEQIIAIMDKLLLPEFLISAITTVDLNLATKEDFNDINPDDERGLYLKAEWFLRDAEENGYVDNIRYFESKGLFSK